MWCPEPAESTDPFVDIAEAAAVDGIHASLGVGAYRSEAVLAQHLQVLRHRGLRDRELVADRRADGASGQFAVGQQFQDPSTDRIAQDVERVHATTIATTYISSH